MVLHDRQFLLESEQGWTSSSVRLICTVYQPSDSQHGFTKFYGSGYVASSRFQLSALFLAARKLPQTDLDGGISSHPSLERGRGILTVDKKEEVDLLSRQLRRYGGGEEPWEADRE
jgi:hypothetical protein